MNNRAYKDIELDIVLKNIASYSLSLRARNYIGPELISNDESILEERYLKIDDLINKLEGNVSLEFFPHIEPIIEFMGQTHRDPSGSDIYKIGDFLHSSIVLYSFLKREGDLEASIFDLEKNIHFSLDSLGSVNENHPRLLPLIKKRDEIKNERFRFSESYIALNRQIVQNDNPVYRNERVVIPIFTKDKKNSDAYIQGQSSSGNTTFIEPFKLVELNNEVVLAEEKIRLEKIKILHELSQQCREIIPLLKEIDDFVIQFSFYYVFALWAKKIKANHIQRGNDLSLIGARHPLLDEKAVAINICVDSKKRVLVLSGANCGGKTVTMKTIALFVALNQIAGFVPAESSSILPLFSDIFTDIGDGQSILSEKSTFSSHMSNISEISRECDESSLVILDELGSGTDPLEGSALSIAILEYLSSKARLTICTSHYNEVKNYAYLNENMMNASMQFDDKTGLPTFKILENIPGDSHAIETAKRAKIPQEIISRAKTLIGKEKNNSSSIITSLLSKTRTLDRKISEAEREKRVLEEERRSLEKKEEEIKKTLLSLEKDGYREINDYLRESRKNLEKLVKDIKTGELNKEKTKSVKTFLSNIEKKVEEVKDNIDTKEETVNTTIDETIAIGDSVYCGRNKTKGRIIAFSNSGALVEFENGMKLNLPLIEITKAPKAEDEKSRVAHFSSLIKKPKLVLDCRGKTLEETKMMIDDEIEAALLSSLFSFSIIHGFGEGILQKGVQEYLKNNRYVESFSFALPEDGGMGKTYVKLKTN